MPAETSITWTSHDTDEVRRRGSRKVRCFTKGCKGVITFDDAALHNDYAICPVCSLRVKMNRQDV